MKATPKGLVRKAPGKPKKPADPELTRVLLERLRANLADAAKAAEARDDDDDEGREGYSGREVVYSVHEGLDVTADSFYSSQGRVGTSFDDRNADLLDRVVGARDVGVLGARELLEAAAQLVESKTLTIAKLHALVPPEAAIANPAPYA